MHRLAEMEQPPDRRMQNHSTDDVAHGKSRHWIVASKLYDLSKSRFNGKSPKLFPLSATLLIRRKFNFIQMGKQFWPSGSLVCKCLSTESEFGDLHNGGSGTRFCYCLPPPKTLNPYGNVCWQCCAKDQTFKNISDYSVEMVIMSVELWTDLGICRYVRIFKSIQKQWVKVLS